MGDLVGDAAKRQSNEFEAAKKLLANRVGELERILSEGSFATNQIKDTLGRETQMREAALKDIHELLGKEKSLREQQHEFCQELLRASTEATVTNSGNPANADAVAEKCRHLGDQVRSLQRSLHS